MNEAEKILIDEALRSFGIETAEYTMLRHNENITCKVCGRYYSEDWFSEAMERWCSTVFTHGKQ